MCFQATPQMHEASSVICSPLDGTTQGINHFWWLASVYVDVLLYVQLNGKTFNILDCLGYTRP